MNIVIQMNDYEMHSGWQEQLDAVHESLPFLIGHLHPILGYFDNLTVWHSGDQLHARLEGRRLPPVSESVFMSRNASDGDPRWVAANNLADLLLRAVFDAGWSVSNQLSRLHQATKALIEARVTVPSFP